MCIRDRVHRGFKFALGNYLGYRVFGIRLFSFLDKLRVAGIFRVAALEHKHEHCVPVFPYGIVHIVKRRQNSLVGHEHLQHFVNFGGSLVVNIMYGDNACLLYTSARILGAIQTKKRRLYYNIVKIEPPPLTTPAQSDKITVY